MKIFEKVRHQNIICRVESPARDLYFHFLSCFILNGALIPGTLCERLVNCDLSPVLCCFNKRMLSSESTHSSFNNCGLVDSLRTLLMHENFIKPYSDEHILATLLTKSF